MQTIQMTMKLPVIVNLSGKWYIASCPILDVIAQGDTEPKAKSNLADALYLFLTSCIERGTLDAVLKESGFRPANKVTALSDDFNEYIDIPLNLLSEMESPQLCRA
ncbi:MAG: hypothetical protein GXP53_01940 [Deltaproteobacteria bacterium]|nr:hypothetical protein [Deltaproteobacteria bacterium]